MEFLKLGFAWIIRNLYDMTGIYSLSIILMTILFNFAIMPLNIKQIKSTENMQKIQPEIQALQKKYQNDKETLNQKIMELYQKNNVNPMAGCLPILIQMPIIWALFGVLREPMKYIFVDNPAAGHAAMAQGFFWISNLAEPDKLSNILNFELAKSLPGLLPIFTSFLTYVQMEISTAKSTATNSSQNNPMSSMKYFMPLMILMFSLRLSAGLVLYWSTGTLFRILQQVIIMKIDEKKELEA